jgi:hypothetical protein
MDAPPLSVDPRLSVDHREIKPPPKLFSPGQVLGTSIIGSVLAGAILLAINQKRLGERSMMWVTLVLGFIVVALSVALGFATDGGHGLHFLPHVLAFGAYEMAKRDNAYHASVAAGSQRASTGAAIGIMLATVVGIIVVAGGGYLAFAKPWGERIRVGQSNLYYADGVTRAEAEKVEKALVDDGYLKPDHGADVQLKREHDGLTLVLVSKWSHPTDEQLRIYQSLSDELDDLLVPLRVKLALADDSFEIQTRVPRLDREDVGKVKIYRFAGATAADARRVVAAMVSAQIIGSDEPHRYELRREPDGYSLSVPLKAGVWDDPRAAAFWSDASQRLVHTLGGQFEVRLCDGDFRFKKKVP